MKQVGVYHCVRCGAELFASATTSASGTGPPHDAESVAGQEDASRLMRRTDVVCRRCGAHPGHVFGDGPQPTGWRYCINSAALNRASNE